MTPSPPLDIVRVVHAELAVPGRYHLHVPVERPSLLGQALQWIADEFGKFLQAIGSHVHVNDAGATVIGDVLLGAALVVVAVSFARLLRLLQADSERTADAASLLPARSAQALARAAAALAEGGEYARAIRLLFSAAVVLLDLRGVVPDDESATINQLRRELRARSSTVEVPFSEIARIYTATAYAESVVDREAWLRARDAYTALSGSA